MSDTAPTNGHFPKTARPAARLYVGRGHFPIPLLRKTKQPDNEGRLDLRVTAADVDRHFPEDDSVGVGLLTGLEVGGLVDVDLDCPEAIACASTFLPPTGMVSGRASRPHSHRWYVTESPFGLDTMEFHDVDGSMLLELRTDRHMTCVPPSIHPDGEPLTWHSFDPPARIEAEDLEQRVKVLATATILAKHWPAKGGRNHAAMALVGGMARASTKPEAVRPFLQAIIAAAKDDEPNKRFAIIDSTFRRIDEGGKVKGWPALAKLIGKDVVDKVLEWMGVATPKKPSKERGDGDAPKKSTATKLVDLVLQTGIELFHHDQTGFATINVVQPDVHRETWPLRSAGFRRWLQRTYFLAEGKAPAAAAVGDAVGTLEGQALFEGSPCPVHVRIAACDDVLYLDLADAKWRVVEIDAADWRIAEKPMVKFRRPKGMMPLPEPVRGGSLDQLRQLVNVRGNDGWLLLLGWIVAAMRPRGPFPVLLLAGEQGTAKTSLGRVLRSLLDPNKTPLRSEPRDERDLIIAASNSSVVALDNISFLAPWMSDALCRLATGGGFSTRQLYSDDEEMIFAETRPVILTSIEDVATRGDLLDRAIPLQLEAIADEKRRTEEDLDAATAAVRPAILGALLDAVSAGLRTLPTVKLGRLPRMADFALWAEACCRGIGLNPGAFLAAYTTNRSEANEIALEGSSLAVVLRKAMDGLPEWAGEAAELLSWLDAFLTDSERKNPSFQKSWPKKPNQLTNQLRRIAPNLRRCGITVSMERNPKTRRRIIKITAKDGEGWSKGCEGWSDPPGGPGGPANPDPEGCPHPSAKDARRMDDNTILRGGSSDNLEAYDEFFDGAKDAKDEKQSPTLWGSQARKVRTRHRGQTIPPSEC